LQAITRIFVSEHKHTHTHIYLYDKRQPSKQSHLRSEIHLFHLLQYIGIRKIGLALAVRYPAAQNRSFHILEHNGWAALLNHHRRKARFESPRCIMDKARLFKLFSEKPGFALGLDFCQSFIPLCSKKNIYRLSNQHHHRPSPHR